MTKGELIRKYRKKNNLTQEQLAEKCGMATITIRQYENGKRTPQIEQLSKIARELDISVIDLMDEADRKTTFFQNFLINMTCEYPSVVAFLEHGTVECFSASDAPERHDFLRSIFSYLNNLNDDGQQKVVDYAGDLVASGKYQRTQDESSHESSHAPTEGETPPEGE